MNTGNGFRALLIACVVLCSIRPITAATPITIDTKTLLVTVDPTVCRWSAEVKGTPMRMNDVYFLPGDDPSGWKGNVPDRMQVRGYCSYKVVMPAGKSFPGEKLLVGFNTDAHRAMEHQADLIAIAHDVRLGTRRPINLDDRELVANNYSRFHGWMSGGNAATTKKFFAEHGLTDFYWGMGGPGPQGSFAIYGSGGTTSGRYPEFDVNGPWGKYPTAGPQGRVRVDFPAEVFLPVRTVKYGGERVLDFSNPLTVTLERERILKWVTGQEKSTGRAEMDFSDWWDKWPGQHDPFMSALETYRAAGRPWREIIDEKAPRMVIRSNMQPIDHSYGVVDILRAPEDADQGYEDQGSSLAGKEFTGLLSETVMGSANRFFYNGRVFWNDADGVHIYRFAAPDKKDFTAGQGKVSANFHAMAANTLFLSEALNVEYPADRMELLKRISPPTPDVGYPVDLFVRRPARVWNMPVARPFGNWSIVSVFNYTGSGTGGWTTSLDAAKDLRLDPDKEYIVYEFWTKKLIGTFKGTFVTTPVAPYDCHIYSVVEKQDRPVLISTSRHVRQMAFDIKDLAYDGNQRTLRGVSRAVAGDPYQLRIYVPEGFTAKRVELSGGMTGTLATDGPLLTVDYTATTGNDVEWKVFF